MAIPNSMRLAAVVQSDIVGQLILVVDRENRKCLVCEQLFSREEATKHANVVCQPRTEYPEHE